MRIQFIDEADQSDLISSITPPQARFLGISMSQEEKKVFVWALVAGLGIHVVLLILSLILG